MALEKYDGEELDPKQLESAVQALPFLSERRMVVVKEASTNKQLGENLDKILSLVGDTTDLVFAEKHPDKRGIYYKTLKKKTEFKEFNSLDRNNLPAWLSQQAKELGGSLSAGDARYLAERVGNSQLMLMNELSKLIDYQPNITRETIDLLTESAPQSTVFELLDAAFAGNTKKALSIYEDQRKQRVEPQAILAMIAWQLHAMAVVKAAGQKDADTIARDSKLNPFVVRKTQSVTRSLSLKDIKDLIRKTMELDISFKSVAIDVDEAIQSLLFQLSHKK
jgi:DNA polymerase-3 subunit delta